MSLEEHVESNPNLDKELGEDRLGAIEALDEADSLQKQVAEGEETATTINAMVEPLEASGEPLTEAGTKALDIAVEHLCKRVGFSKRRTPAFEGYVGKKPNVTLEGLKEVGSAIWQAILKAIAKIKEWLKAIYTFFFNSDKKIEAGAKVAEQEIKLIQKEHSPADIKATEAKVEEKLKEAKVSPDAAVFSAEDAEKINAMEANAVDSVKDKNKDPFVKHEYYSYPAIKNASLANFFHQPNYPTSYFLSKLTEYVETMNEEVCEIVSEIDYASLETSVWLKAQMRKRDDVSLEGISKMYYCMIKLLAPLNLAQHGSSSFKINETVDGTLDAVVNLPFDRKMVLNVNSRTGDFSIILEQYDKKYTDNQSLIQACPFRYSKVILESITKNKMPDTYFKVITEQIADLEKKISKIENTEEDANFLKLAKRMMAYLNFNIRLMSVLLEYRTRVNRNALIWIGRSNKYWEAATAQYDELKAKE